MRGKPIFALVAMVMAAAAGPAAATVPGANGRIAFVNIPSANTPGVWTINPDGTDRTQVVNQLFSNGGHPVFSPDRQRIAASFDGDIHYMDPDGGNLANVTQSPQGDWEPSWSPDGTRIAFWGDSHEPGIQPAKIVVTSIYGQDRVELTNGFSPSWSPDGAQLAFVAGVVGDEGNYDIFKINIDGSGLTRLTETPGPRLTESDPEWSPDGSKIVYCHDGSIWTMNADGTGETRVTPGPPGFDPLGRDCFPSWSPDGERIAFARVTYYEEFCPSGCSLQATDLMTMKPDGSDVQNVTNTQQSPSETHPSWESIRPPEPPGYPRPQAASPMRVSLVPAYAPCAAPNRRHGPPLSFESCAPPWQLSGTLMVGAATGSESGSVGFLKIRTRMGDPSTPADEADVTVWLRITDVRKRLDGSDYSGELGISFPFRLTDRLSSTGLTASTAGTVQGDISLTASAPCAPTADAATGSTCELSTTAGALVPGGVPEGARSIWELGAIEISDGGNDGDADTEPNSPLAKPGVFVP
jgi:TolB protein